MSEPREIEPKLECESTDLATLQQHPLLQKASERRGGAQLGRLRYGRAAPARGRAGVRVRRIGDRHVQTLKAEGDGLFSRPEWEQTVNGPEPDLAVLGDTPLDAILGRKDGLHPLFTTSVKPQTCRVVQGSSRIAVALDSGQITAQAAGDRVLPICELKQGSAGDVFALSQAIAALVPLRLGVRSKAERGYSLSAVSTPETD